MINPGDLFKIEQHVHNDMKEYILFEGLEYLLILAIKKDCGYYFCECLNATGKITIISFDQLTRYFKRVIL